MTLAGLQGILQAYRDGTAVCQIPTLYCLAQTKKETRERAERLLQALHTDDLPACVSLRRVDDCVGGGACPDAVLPGWALAIDPYDLSAEKLEQRLRQADIPIIARVQHCAVALSLRTIGDDEFQDVAASCGKRWAFERRVEVSAIMYERAPYVASIQKRGASHETFRHLP